MKVRSIHLVIGLVIPLNLFALGLGEIRVYSHLNEPFRAEIPLIDAGSIPIASIKADIGNNEEFERVGLTRDEVLSLLDLKVQRNSEGRLVVALNSSERIQTPYLEILVDLAWPDGELYRAFTVLLDPPHYPIGQENGALSEALPFKQLKNGPKSKTWFNSNSDKYKEKEYEKRPDSSYGPTLVDESIWQIAKRYQIDGLTLPQVVLAIVGENPDAFKEGNLNGLKAASHLNIPSVDEMFKVPVNLGAQEIEVHDIAWQSHTQIHHVLAPPYIQGIQEMTSLIPSYPTFTQNPALPLTLDLKNASQGSAKEEKSILTDATNVLATRLKVLEMDNGKLTKSLQQKEQENHTLRQKLEELRKQIADLQMRLSTHTDDTGRGWLIYPLLLVALAGAYLAWQRHRIAASQPNEVPPSIVPPSVVPTPAENEPLEDTSESISSEDVSAENNEPLQEEPSIEPSLAEGSTSEIEKEKAEEIAPEVEPLELPLEAVEAHDNALLNPEPDDNTHTENEVSLSSQEEEPAVLEEKHTPELEEAIPVEKVDLTNVSVTSSSELTSEESESQPEESESLSTEPSLSALSKELETELTASTDPFKTANTSFKFEDESSNLNGELLDEVNVKSPEALATLLSLAKTYISRGDLQAAKQSLEEVLTHGTREQQEEASLLLEQIEGQK